MSDVRAIYDRMSAEYDRRITPSRVSQFLTLAHELALTGRERVLDLGSGPGVLSLQLAKLLHDGEVVGVDLSDRMVELAREKTRGMGLTNVKFVQGDALDLRFPDGAFDVVVSSYLVHWVPDVGRLTSEIQRVLKRGGRLGIIAPAPDRYSELREAYRVIARQRQRRLTDPQVGEIAGLRKMQSGALLEALRSSGFRIDRHFQVSFKERLAPEVYLERISAITDERYLESVPPEERGMVCAEIMRELARSRNSDLLTTESSIFVVATKES